MAIQETYYYIIKVAAKDGRYCYYKIGESCTESRPKKLIEKYGKLSANQAEQLAFDQLPHNNSKRLNDKTIHAKIDQTKMKRADPIYVEHYLKETDGKEEFFELVDKNLDVVDYIKSVVKSCTAKDYKAKNREIINLTFGDSYHLVSDTLVSKIEEKFPEVDNILFNTHKDAVVLIGQFEHDFVASFAMSNNVIIWHDTAEQKHIFGFSKLNDHIKYFEGTLDEFIEEVKDTKINLIIANPPYGPTGANITDKIIHNVDFDEYINLLPANDYKRNDSKDLYNYQSDMVAVTKSNMGSADKKFADASVTTHLAKIHKTKVNNMTLDEFEISQYQDKHLIKYFTENRNRTYSAIDNSVSWIYFDGKLENTHTALLDHRFIANKHLAYSKNTPEYKWNVECSVDLAWLQANCKCPSTPGKLNKFTVTFNTAVEKTNFTTFLYSTKGFKFISKMATGCNGDSTIPLGKILPKVDWTRSWAVEEILADYGYTEDEIKAVVDDLVNYKGMED